MARWRCLLLAWLALILASGLPGCGSKTPAPTSVKGQIWYHGEPLNGGMIVFVPDEERGNSGPLIKGSLQSDGTFVLTSEVRTGWYRVAVAPPTSAAAAAPTAANPYPGVPSRYRNPQLSGLQGEIKAGSENVFEFSLDDA